jgi:hypothetical protein
MNVYKDLQKQFNERRGTHESGSGICILTVR